ncbi:MAG TPA: hypothetical protein PKC15_07805 [Rhodocyclaceae bacterium]|uniref:hypothetical protein n=1 Tax=Plasticicumulans sp. TaxID=2307179 RepID=UPI002B6D93CB|nr:hypothetical protein [Rhodocyclaceae bacterium]
MKAQSRVLAWGNIRAFVLAFGASGLGAWLAVKNLDVATVARIAQSVMFVFQVIGTLSVRMVMAEYGKVVVAKELTRSQRENLNEIVDRKASRLWFMLFLCIVGGLLASAAPSLVLMVPPDWRVYVAAAPLFFGGLPLMIFILVPGWLAEQRRFNSAVTDMENLRKRREDALKNLQPLKTDAFSDNKALQGFDEIVRRPNDHSSE